MIILLSFTLSVCERIRNIHSLRVSPSPSDLEVLSPFHHRFIRTSIVDHYNRML